jgi:hypothetical protein
LNNKKRGTPKGKREKTGASKSKRSAAGDIPVSSPAALNQ